jgi:hypothetical protein
VLEWHRYILTYGLFNSISHLSSLQPALLLQDKLWQFYKKRLAAISELQTKVKDSQNRVSLYSQAMTKQHQPYFQRLSVIRQMPAAYQAVLAEVSRRRAFKRVFKVEANQMAERLSRSLHDEATRRERYHSSWTNILPSTFIDGLHDRLVCDVTIGEFDTSLPSIDIDSSGMEMDIKSIFASTLPATEVMSRLEAENTQLKRDIALLRYHFYTP